MKLFGMQMFVEWNTLGLLTSKAWAADEVLQADNVLTLSQKRRPQETIIISTGEGPGHKGKLKRKQCPWEAKRRDLLWLLC